MQRIIVNLHISTDEFLKLYQGVAENVVTRAVDGRTVQFPARILKPFVQYDGVKGRFQILFDNQGKFQRIERI